MKTYADSILVFTTLYSMSQKKVQPVRDCFLNFYNIFYFSIKAIDFDCDTYFYRFLVAETLVVVYYDN